MKKKSADQNADNNKPRAEPKDSADENRKDWLSDIEREKDIHKHAKSDEKAKRKPAPEAKELEEKAKNELGEIKKKGKEQ